MCVSNKSWILFAINTSYILIVFVFDSSIDHRIESEKYSTRHMASIFNALDISREYMYVMEFLIDIIWTTWKIQTIFLAKTGRGELEMHLFWIAFSIYLNPRLLVITNKLFVDGSKLKSKKRIKYACGNLYSLIGLTYYAHICLLFNIFN